MTRRSTVWLWTWCGFTLAITAFVLFNGSRTSSESMSMSGWVMALLTPILNALSRVLGDVDWSFWIRKAAHATEYAALGFAATSTAVQLQKRFGRSFVTHAALYALVIAVSDEFIQGFVGRTSAVSDVVIDFCGALVGLGMAIWIGRWGRSSKRKGEPT